MTHTVGSGPTCECQNPHGGASTCSTFWVSWARAINYSRPSRTTRRRSAMAGGGCSPPSWTGCCTPALFACCVAGCPPFLAATMRQTTATLPRRLALRMATPQMCRRRPLPLELRMVAVATVHLARSAHHLMGRGKHRRRRHNERCVLTVVLLSYLFAAARHRQHNACTMTTPPWTLRLQQMLRLPHLCSHE